MPRPMTAAERARFLGLFPNLNVNAAIVTDNATRAYNCIAWTVGITNRWLWPGSSIADFDTFYHRFGFARSGNGPIAAWGYSVSNMTHGCVSGPGHGPRWESKCGGDLRIQHGLNELLGSTYGRVLAFYHRDRTLPGAYEAVLEDVMNEKAAKSYISAAQRRALAEMCENVPKRILRRFR